MLNTAIALKPALPADAVRQDESRAAHTPKILLRLLMYARPYSLYLGFAILLSAASTAVGLVPPYLTKILVDQVLVPGGSLDLLLFLIGGLLALEVVALLLGLGRSRLFAWIGGRITLDVRTDLFQHLQRLAVRFYDRQQVGALMARITQDAGSFQGFLANTLPELATNLLTFIGVFAVTCSMDAHLTLIALVPAVLLTLGGTVFWRRLRPLQRQVWERWARLNSLLNSAISGVRIVKAFAQEKRQKQEFTQENEGLFRANMNVQWVTAAYLPLMGLAGSLATFMVWVLGGRDILAGRITLGTVMAFLAYLAKLQGPVHFLAHLPGAYSTAHVGAQRIFEILDTAPEPYDHPNALPVPRARGEIELQGVTFGYEPHAPVLHGIDLHVRSGELVGIVGQTGAGKSSLINLICRFYDPDQGRVCLDGMDVRRLCLQELRRQIGIVPQDPFLFDTSVAANIAFADPEAAPTAVLEAAWRAQAHGFILRLPDGYDTCVGERGVRLSGGERQRISIARVLLHDPAVLVLDEATSSVDVETEEHLQQTMASLLRSRTALVIAHRFSTLRQMDRLVVLEQGRKVEEGSHAELMARRGVYWRLVKLQGLERDSKEVEVDTLQPAKLAWMDGGDVRLQRSAGGGLDLLFRDGRVKHSVEVLRAFPLSAPDQCIAFLDRCGKGVDLLAQVNSLDEGSRGALVAALEHRYALPVIVRIRDIQDEGEVVRWKVDTDRESKDLVIRRLRESISAIAADRLRIVDREGKQYVVHPAQLDRRSRRRLRESWATSHVVLGFRT